jgi:anti-anti-sigma factor
MKRNRPAEREPSKRAKLLASMKWSRTPFLLSTLLSSSDRVTFPYPGKKMDNELDHITARPNGDALVLEIISTTLNDFDLAHAVANEIEKSVSDWPNKKVILSLKNVNFVTSVGLIVFARLITYVKQSGVRLVLCDAAEQIAKVLKITRVVTTESGQGEQRLLLKLNLNAALSELAG